MRRGVGLTDQLPCDCAVEADSALQEAPLALRYHLHETASGARTGENPTRQTRCNEYLLTRPPSTKSLKISTAVHHKDMWIHADMLNNEISLDIISVCLGQIQEIWFMFLNVQSPKLLQTPRCYGVMILQLIKMYLQTVTSTLFL